MDYFCYDYLNIWLNTLVKAWIGKIWIYYDILIIILDYKYSKKKGPGRFRALTKLAVNIAIFKIWQRNIK